MSLQTNKTTIVFDDKFKTIIKEIQKIKEIDTNDIYELLEFQSNMREYIKETYPNLIKNKFPDFFGVFIALTLDIDNYDKWEDVSEKFELKEIFDTSLNIPDNLDFKCACGHSIHKDNMYIVFNEKSNIKILLGSTCIDKNKIVYDFKRIKQERKLKLKKIEKDKCAAWNDYNESIKNEREKINLLNKPNECKMCLIEIKKPYIYCYGCRIDIFDKCDCGTSKRKNFNKCYNCFKK